MQNEIEIEELATCECCQETFPEYLIKPVELQGHPKVMACGLCAWEMIRLHFGLRKENPTYPTEVLAVCIGMCQGYREKHGRKKHVTELK